MKKVFIVCYGGGHVNMIIPVIKRLKTLNLEVKVLGLTTAETALKKHGIESFGYRHYLSLFKDQNEIQLHGSDLKKDLPANNEIPSEETIAYLGLSYWDLEQKLGKVEALRKYSSEGRYCFFQTKVMEVILEHEKPDFLLTTNSPRTELASLVISKKLKIPNSCLVDQYSKVIFEDRFQHADYIDHYFVPMDFDKSKLTDLGVPAYNITVSGNPAFENHFSVENINQAKDFRKTYFFSKETVITYAKAPSYSIFAEVDSEVIDKLLKFIKANPEFGLIIRNHPNDLASCEQVKGVFYSTKVESVAMILHATDIIISQGSTVGMEGKLLGKTVVQYSDKRSPASIDQEEIGIASKVDSFEDLETLLKGFMTLKERHHTSQFQDTSVIPTYIGKVLNSDS